MWSFGVGTPRLYSRGLKPGAVRAGVKCCNLSTDRTLLWGSRCLGEGGGGGLARGRFRQRMCTTCSLTRGPNGQGRRNDVRPTVRQCTKQTDSQPRHRESACHRRARNLMPRIPRGAGGHCHPSGTPATGPTENSIGRHVCVLCIADIGTSALLTPAPWDTDACARPVPRHKAEVRSKIQRGGLLSDMSSAPFAVANRMAGEPGLSTAPKGPMHYTTS